ncbi:MAG: lysyl oxidase family protein [Anaerolineales bacterium]
MASAILLMLCACATGLQPTSMSGQPTVTTSQSIERTNALSATRTPLPASTPANSVPRSALPANLNPSATEAELVRALQQGGFVIYLRTADAEIQNLELCVTQSVLSDQARVDATAFGATFLTLGIPVGQVLTGDTCTSYETALQAFGRAKSWADLNGSTILLRGERTSVLRRLLSTSPPPGTNNVLVGDELNIKDVTGIILAEGEAAIYQPMGKIGYSFVARVLLEEWDELEKHLPGLVRTEPCNINAIQLELVSPIYGSKALPRQGSEQDDGRGEICMPEQQLGFSEDLPLPDLITLPPTDLRIRINPVSGQKLLRFTNSIMNEGLGAMELIGSSNPDTGKVTVAQRIYTGNGSGQNVTVGEFFFHKEHSHWHFGKFARYEIWSLGLDGDLDSVVAFSNKVSYCLRDDERADMPGAASYQSYTACDQNSQGISVGWIDTYRHHLEGQSIDITFLPDGVYALRSVVDPDKKLWERNYENNDAILYFELEGKRVNIIELTDI